MNKVDLLNGNYNKQCAKPNSPPNPPSVDLTWRILIGSCGLSLPDWCATVHADQASSKWAISSDGGWSTARAASDGHWQASPEIIIPAGYFMNFIIILFKIPELLIDRMVSCWLSRLFNSDLLFVCSLMDSGFWDLLIFCPFLNGFCSCSGLVSLFQLQMLLKVPPVS